MKSASSSIALPIVLGAIALMQPARVEAQSLYRLWDAQISIAPSSGQSALSSYLLRFGIFTNNFTPTAANFSQWNANFAGSTGVFDGVQGGPYGPVPGAYAAEFSASNNSLYPLGAQLYMVVYNVAPISISASASDLANAVASATQGVILTRTDWIIQGPDRQTTGARRWYIYYYDVNGHTRHIGDLSEDNIAPPTSTSAFSSPVNTFSLGTGGVLQTSFDMVPEPSAVSLLAIGFGGWIVLRRVRRKAD
jgi:hypothetical protein